MIRVANNTLFYGSNSYKSKLTLNSFRLVALYTTLQNRQKYGNDSREFDYGSWDSRKDSNSLWL